MQYYHNTRVAVLLLHLVDKVISCNGEFLLDDIAHVHEILKTLLEHSVYTNTVWLLVSCVVRRGSYLWPTVCLNTQVHLSF